MVRFKQGIAALVAIVCAACSSTTTERKDLPHPFDSVGPCLKTYTVIAIPYLAILSTYAAAPLVILRPRFESGRAWAAALCATPLVNYIGVLAAFTLTSALGTTNYPHDTTPYYYIDWGVMALALLIQTLYVGGVIWRFATLRRQVEA